MAATPTKTQSVRAPGSVVQVFCGVGGLAYGLWLEGFDIVAGIDVDAQCQYPFEYNNEAKFILRDVDDMKAEEISKLFRVGQPRVLVGCAPCQPFSNYNKKNNDPNWKLVGRFCDHIVHTKPDIVSMENVPRLVEYRAGEVFDDFLDRLKEAGYHVSYQTLFLPDYGLPQNRSRLVVMASLHGQVELEDPTYSSEHYRTVEQAIGDLPPLAAGETDVEDPLHRSSRLSPLNLRRVRASIPGGSWSDWEHELVATCHRVRTGKGYKSVYGRMKFDQPSPTITTQFFGFGNGRFGHPEQDRALSLREGAILQSFPRHYRFVPPGGPIQFKAIGRMIGNAVPVLLGQVIGRAIASHLLSHGFASSIDDGRHG